MITKRDTQRWTLPLVLFAVVVTLWLINLYTLTHVGSLSTWSERGTFGDMFGALNTLFSGLAFAGVIYAICLQTEELALQREEVRSTREELRRAADAQERTERALAEQVRIAAITAALQGEAAIMAGFDDQRDFGAKRAFIRIRHLQAQLETAMGLELPPS